MGETADTPRARALSAALREALAASGIGVNELARRLSMSHTPISLWLAGKRVPDVEKVATLLGALHVHPDERERILDLARNAKEPNWLTVGVPGISQQLAGAVESERTAAKITEWSPWLIPGLTQTPDYARAVVSNNGRKTADAELRLMLRMGRSEVITRSDPVGFDALIGESALLDPVGSAESMREQLTHLVELARRPNVSIWVVPQGVGYHAGRVGPFVFYEFRNTTPVVHFEHFSSGAFVHDYDNVKEYQETIETLKQLAISQEDSPAYIARIAEKWS